MNRRTITTFVAGGVVAAAALAGVPALAATVTPQPGALTSPQLTINPPRFVLGAQTGDVPAPVDGCSGSTYPIPTVLPWQARAGSQQIVKYDVLSDDGQGGGGTTTYTTSATTGSQSINGTDYDSECGGGVYSLDYSVTATNSAGFQASAATNWLNYRVWQEDGVGWAGNFYTGNLPITKTGAWTPASCACFSWGKDLTTSAAGAKINYTVSTPGYVAIVAPKSNLRGKMSVSVDGAAGQTVDLFSSTNVSRIIVWQAYLKPGTHTLTITNQATAGHPRIDIDSILNVNYAGVAGAPARVQRVG